MSERQAPYLHLVRSDEPTAETTETRSEGAQEVETSNTGDVSSSPSLRQPAPRSVEGGPSSDVDVTDTPDDAVTPDDRGLTPTTQPLANAVMYAAASWLALCVERSAVAMDIQPLADRLYEVSVHYDEARTDGILLRVRLDVEPGLVIRSTVEPLRP